MSGVFRNIDPPPPHLPASGVYPPPPGLWCGVRTHSLGGEGVGGRGVNSSVRKTPDTADCSVLYICKYFVAAGIHGDLCANYDFRYTQKNH
jgi:hypothetical protein